MKKIIFIIFILCMMPIVFAISEGDIYTQQQLNSINPDTIGLQCRLDGFYYAFGAAQAQFQFSCLNIQYREDTKDYLIIRTQWWQWYNLIDYLNCKKANNNNRIYCVSQIRIEMLNQFIINKQVIRENIRKYQTNTDLTENDFNYLPGELN